MYSYIIEKGKEGDYACARLEGVDASVKDLVQVCGNIRRKDIAFALALLEKAAEGKIPLRFRSNNKRLGHRRELGGKKGRYPRKSAKIVLGVLKSALANAQQKGLSEELIVTHACANKVARHLRYSPKGRRNISALTTARVEIILKEKEGAKRPPKKAKKEEKPPAKGEEKPAEKAAPPKAKEEKPAPPKAKEAAEEKPAEEAPKEEKKAAPEPKPPAEKPKEAVKKSEEKKEKEAVKAEMRAESRKLEEKREEHMKDHPKKEEKALPPGKKPAFQKK